jgi:hypothetical protein
MQTPSSEQNIAAQVITAGRLVTDRVTFGPGATMSANLIRVPEQKRTNRVLVGQDLDGVNYSFDWSYWRAMVLLGHIDGWKKPYVEAPTWEFYKDLYGQTTAEFIAICNEGADKGIIFATDAPYKGAIEAWRSIKADGHEIHIKTARAFGSHPAVSEAATYAWLRGTGPTTERAYDSLIFTHDKTEGVAVDIMLEDYLVNYDALDAAGVNVWLIDRPWNRAPGCRRRRVFNHAEFVTRVQDLAREKTERAAAIEAELAAMSDADVARHLAKAPAMLAELAKSFG